MFLPSTDTNWLPVSAVGTFALLEPTLNTSAIDTSTTRTTDTEATTFSATVRIFFILILIFSGVDTARKGSISRPHWSRRAHATRCCPSALPSPPRTNRVPPDGLSTPRNRIRPAYRPESRRTHRSHFPNRCVGARDVSGMLDVIGQMVHRHRRPWADPPAFEPLVVLGRKEHGHKGDHDDPAVVREQPHDLVGNIAG